MKKKTVSAVLLLLCCILLVGCQSHDNKERSSSSHETTTKQTTRSNSSQKQGNAVSSGSAKISESTSINNTKVDDKTAGVMLALLVSPDWFKDYIGTETFCYCPASENKMGGRVAGYNYLTANGDPTSFLYYRVDGDTVTYKMWVPNTDGGVANGHYETKTVSLNQLENDYYVNAGQKDEVNGYVKKLNDQTAYLQRIESK
ncbi:hypothetical protein [uncultured Limosilactobacillus sp.]|uniref:Lreu_0056 family protein n=1 Tax=uncultured Limosilactobacillus sp. TaxID=2837629 RepID=UPI0025FCB256|nr:hypothetical protein [uncultured Limosilactobacillus sp.]